MRISADWNRNKIKKTYVGIFALMGLMVVAAFGRFAERVTEQTMKAEQIEKKVAITFDAEVIIGLSQEISYKEAVSMI